mmetsp:Transcript_6866/g.28959  ORF Transcript_6866/g.28959 Transcript_6866/m.28959 type:complete len:211 (+) Transcript_6866:1710-2342(+)
MCPPLGVGSDAEAEPSRRERAIRLARRPPPMYRRRLPLNSRRHIRAPGRKGSFVTMPDMGCATMSSMPSFQRRTFKRRRTNLSSSMISQPAHSWLMRAEYSPSSRRRRSSSLSGAMAEPGVDAPFPLSSSASVSPFVSSPPGVAALSSSFAVSVPLLFIACTASKTLPTCTMATFSTGSRSPVSFVIAYCTAYGWPDTVTTFSPASTRTS